MDKKFLKDFSIGCGKAALFGLAIFGAFKLFGVI